MMCCYLNVQFQGQRVNGRFHPSVKLVWRDVISEFKSMESFLPTTHWPCIAVPTVAFEKLQLLFDRMSFITAGSRRETFACSKDYGFAMISRLNGMIWKKYDSLISMKVSADHNRDIVYYSTYFNKQDYKAWGTALWSLSFSRYRIWCFAYFIWLVFIAIFDCCRRTPLVRHIKIWTVVHLIWKD